MILCQNENNKIYAYTELDKKNGFIPKEMKELTNKQLTAYENKPEFGIWNGNEWIANIEEIEKARINSINLKADEIITKPYPIYKQLNIDNLLNPYTIEMRENKNMFIETVRNIGRMAKEDGTQPDDINWAGLDEITEPYQVTQDLILKAKNLLGE